jgi:hypothetical protein
LIEGQIPKIAVNPYKLLGKRISPYDISLADKPINYNVFPDYKPNMIYQIKALPADERSLHKFNGASFDNIDSNANGR